MRGFSLRAETTETNQSYTIKLMYRLAARGAGLLEIYAKKDEGEGDARKTQNYAAAVYAYTESNMFHLPSNNLLSLEPCLMFCIAPILQNIFMHPSAVSIVTSGRRHTCTQKSDRGQ